MSHAPQRALAYQPHFSSANRVYPGMNMEHTHTGFYNQSNGGITNGGMSKKMKDTNSMTQYYSDNFIEIGQGCNTDSKGAPFSNMNRANSFSRPLNSMVKYERQTSFDTSCSQPLSQTDDCQLSQNKWVTENLSKRNEAFSSEFGQMSKRPKYEERDFGGTTDEKPSCDLATKPENSC